MRHPSFLLALIFFTLMSFTSVAFGQNYQLSPTYGEESLTSGFEPDPFNIELDAGGSIDASALGASCVGRIANAPDFRLNYEAGDYPLFISVESAEDTSLAINTPSSDWQCDDDTAGNLNPVVSFSDPESGVYDIYVGGVELSSGSASAILSISEIDPFSGNEISVNPVEIPLIARNMEELEIGSLAEGDSTRDNGAWQDSYSFNWQESQRLVIDLRSEDFDSYLTLLSPSGEQFINDDFQSQTNRSLLNMVLPESGDYQVIISSFAESETGSYLFGIDTDIADESAIDINERGSLTRQDETREGAQYVDSFEFEGFPGTTIIANLNSSSFDPLLIIESPSGIIIENDDYEGSTEHSMILTELAETGLYHIQISSYGAGETGSYSFSLEAQGSDQALPAATPLNPDEEQEGSLMAGLDNINDNRYRDHFSLQSAGNEYLKLTLQSSQFDTHLSLIGPDGYEIENDDFEGSTEMSQIEYLLSDSGDYSIVVSSYREREIGDYRILATTSDNPFSATQLLAGDNNVYGIFVGISDYSELRETVDAGWGDLNYTADDAIIARDTLMSNAGMEASNAITLIDRDASIENITEAFSDMADRVGPNDTFVFFYSGHGGQEVRSEGPNAADADGYDETLALSNATITDDQISALFDQVNAATSLIILDSCYSGGFAKEVVSKPGRMGLFSSDEDVPSLVATKFQAGGYLSHFFREALEMGNADDDGDAAISAMELSQYLHERYTSETKSAGSSTFNTPDFGYQHLVADRGGVSHDSVLFTLR